MDNHTKFNDVIELLEEYIREANDASFQIYIPRDYEYLLNN